MRHLLAASLVGAVLAGDVAAQPTAPALYPGKDVDASVLGRLADLAFSNDGRLLAAAGSRGYGCGTPKPAIPFDSDAWRAASQRLAFGAQGTFLALGGDDGRVRVVDLRSDTAHMAKHNKAITAIAFSNDGRTGASGDIDGNIALWDPDRGLIAAAPGRRSEEGHHRAVVHGQHAAVGEQGPADRRVGRLRQARATPQHAAVDDHRPDRGADRRGGGSRRRKAARRVATRQRTARRSAGRPRRIGGAGGSAARQPAGAVRHEQRHRERSDQDRRLSSRTCSAWARLLLRVLHIEFSQSAAAPCLGARGTGPRPVPPRSARTRHRHRDRTSRAHRRRCRRDRPRFAPGRCRARRPPTANATHANRRRLAPGRLSRSERKRRRSCPPPHPAMPSLSSASTRVASTRASVTRSPR